MKRVRVDNKKTVWLRIAGIVLLLILLVPAGMTLAQYSLIIETFAVLPPGSLPGALVYGPGHSYWLSQMEGNAITFFQEPDALSEITLFNENSKPYDAVVGPDKLVWFTENQNSSLGKIELDGLTPTGEQIVLISEYELPASGRDPNQILFGQEGGLWFTEFNANKIGFRTPSGEMKEYAVSAGARPMGISSDQNGNIWFTEWGTKAIGKINPEGELVEIPIPGAIFRPTEMIRDQYGYLWVLFDNLGKVLRLNPATQIIETFEIGSKLSSSFVDIALGVDGKIWLLGTESIGWFDITDSGPQNFEEMEINPKIFEGEGRAQLVAGPDSNMLFTHNNNDTIAQIQLPDSGMRDLQIFLDKQYPQVLAAGEFYQTVELINWSLQDAEDVSLTLELDENIELVEIQGIPEEDCKIETKKVICLVGNIPASSSFEALATFRASRIPDYIVERSLAFSVDLGAGDYLPTNNRQFRTVNIRQSIDYFNDFAVEAEQEYWSHTQITPSETASETLGRFSNENVSITFENLPPHDEITICFQLYVMGDWDGNQFKDPDSITEPVPTIGPDIWVNYIDNNRLVVASFSNQPQFLQSFPDNYREGEHPAQLGSRAIGDFDSDGVINDARYDFCYLRKHQQNSFKTTFYGVNLASDQGETWSIDNVKAKIYYHALYDWLYMPIIGQ